MKNLGLNMCPQGKMGERRKRSAEKSKRSFEDPMTFWAEVTGNWPDNRYGSIATDVMSEDCLTLNVWAPTQGDGNVHPPGSLPVMVFFFGGGYTIGTANSNVYEGTALSWAANAVVVTFNYRLGAFGFLKSSASEPTANVGLMDQAQVLKWVQSNIESFGGDKDRVTAFGESAGAASIEFLMMSPVTVGTFHRAILQSGVATQNWAYTEPNEAEKVSVFLAQSVGCAGESSQNVDDAILACMRGKDITDIINAAQKVEENGMLITPTSDDWLFPDTPEAALKKEVSKKYARDVIIGFNRNEGALFMPKTPEFGPGVTANDHLSSGYFDQWVRKEFPEAELPFVMDMIRSQYFTGIKKDLIDLKTDNTFRCKIAQMAKELSANRNVYTYLFDVPLDMMAWAPYLGPAHMFELYFVFGRPWTIPSLFSDEERQVSSEMMNSWGAFANGNSERMGGPFRQQIPAGSAFVIKKGGGNRQEFIKMEKCEFLDCLPSLADLGKKQPMKDMSCLRFVFATPRKNKGLHFCTWL